jgi:NodT family efflux transporter outer membrane factor (OMF) lipoprotein
MAPSPLRPRWIVTALSAALLLAGCASTHGLAPSSHPMEADQLAVKRSLSGGASDAAFPKQDWWTALGDPQLSRLIDEALAGTPTLELADARVRQAIAQAGLADAARQPTVAASGQYSGIHIPESIAPEPLGGSYKGIFLLGLNFKYSPDLWGGQRARWQAALGQARAAEVEAQDARLLLASNVAKAYVGLAEAYAALDVATAEQQRSTGLLGLGRQRVRAGLDNQLSLRQAESAVASAQALQQAAQQQIDAARNALAALLGKGPDRGLDIAKPTLLAAPPAGVPDVVPSELLGHRPDVVAARWQVEAASHDIRASKAAFYPTVNLSALVGLAAGSLGDLFNSNAFVAQGGPAISLPIFDGGRLRSQLASSDAQYDLAVANYNQTLVGALREVVDALQAARALDAQIASTTQARDAAQAAITLASQRYRAGLGTQLDVLSAQHPLLQLDQQLALLRAQRLATSVDLDRALGGGLVLTSPSNDIAKAPTP